MRSSFKNTMVFSAFVVLSIYFYQEHYFMTFFLSLMIMFLFMNRMAQYLLKRQNNRYYIKEAEKRLKLTKGGFANPKIVHQSIKLLRYRNQKSKRLILWTIIGLIYPIASSISYTYTLDSVLIKSWVFATLIFTYFLFDQHLKHELVIERNTLKIIPLQQQKSSSR